jgi:allantoin racemase
VTERLNVQSPIPRAIGVVNATSGFSDDERALRRREFRRHIPEDVELIFESIEGGPQFFDRGEQFGEAISAAERFFSSFDWSRFGVMIWSGAIDPGLGGVRALSPIPVIGPGEAALYLASIWGRPLSVITVDSHAVEVTGALLKQVGSKPPIASVRSMDVPVRRIVQDREAGRAAIRREAAVAVSEDGAEVLYLGSMTLGTLGLDDELKSDLGVAVLNPIKVAARTALEALESRGSWSPSL